MKLCKIVIRQDSGKFLMAEFPYLVLLIEMKPMGFFLCDVMPTSILACVITR